MPRAPCFPSPVRDVKVTRHRGRGPHPRHDAEAVRLRAHTAPRAPLAAQARALALVPLLALAGCGGGDDSGRKGADGAAGVAGSVTVSGDDALAASLTWQRPEVVLVAADVPAARRRAEQAVREGRLYQDAESAIPLYLAMLALDPADARAEAGLARAFETLQREGDAALEDARSDDAGLIRAVAVAAVMRTVAPGRFEAETRAYLERVDFAERVADINARAEVELAARRYGDTGDTGALPLFRQALGMDPGQPRATQGIAAVESALLREAEVRAEQGDFDGAQAWLARAATVRPGMQTVEDGRVRVEEIRTQRILRLHGEGLKLLTEPHRIGHIAKARENLAEILRIARPGNPYAGELRERIDLATYYGLMRPGQRFTDALRGGGRGPEMIVVPHGGFRMGARINEPGATDSEKPSRYVRFDRGFAMSRTEVTVGEFRRFVEAGTHRPRAVRRGHSFVYDDRGGNFIRRSGVDWRHDFMGRPAAEDMPVVHVSSGDAEAYARWLSEVTGERYRLPSEAEFEYALRAGRTGLYPWGDAPPPPRTGNLTGSGDRSPGGRSWGNAFDGYRDLFWGPAPVGLFRANPFGLHDLEGNVSEWVADCWHDGYRRAPTNGEAWVNPGCRTRVVRGGAWANAPVQARSAWRIQAERDVTNARTGFRVVRDL